MNYKHLMKSSRLLLFLLVLVASCSEPKVRKPITHNSGKVSYFEESIELNKAILKREERLFKKIITNDTINHYKASPYGFWYYYNKSYPKNTKVKSGDHVVLNYEIKDLNNKILIAADELGSKNQKNKKDRLLIVDGEDFLLGLHEGIKLMREGEIVTFLMPSNKAFGATGLQNKIAPNQALIIKVELKKIIK